MDMARPASGETFSAEISRVSGSGNGIITQYQKHINIGPVFDEAAGKQVEATMTSTGTFAWCHTDSVKPPGYRGEFKRMISGKAASQYCAKCDTELDTDELWACDECGESPDNREKPSSERATDDSTDEESDKEEIEILREKAKYSNTGSSSDTQEKIQTEVTRYQRSTEIRDYVLARADGICEGCNEPAPFTSKTGEPYLHAHHIHELSEGGSDSVDTVVALCPNCHYRIHHGEDGDEFNQELLDIVEELEHG